MDERRKEEQLEIHFGGSGEIENARVVSRFVSGGGCIDEVRGRAPLRRLHHAHALVLADATLEEVRLALQRDVLHEVERVRHVEDLFVLELFFHNESRILDFKTLY